MRKTLAQVQSHWTMRDFRKHANDFIVMNWLLIYFGFEMGAATLKGIPHLKRVAAFGMMMQDFLQGLYKGVVRLIVPSSGNTGEGIAYFAAAFGLKVTVIMPADSPEAKKDVIRKIPGARLLCPKAGESVQALAEKEAKKPGCLLVDQYKHMGNVLIHQKLTGPALLRAIGKKKLKKLIVAVAMGSGGTATGVALYLKSVLPCVVALGVRPKPGQKVDGVRDVHRMDEVVTIPYQFAVDHIIEVEHDESFFRANELRRTGLDVGPSSGLAQAGLREFLASLSPKERKRFRGYRAVFICPDKGVLYDWSV